MDALFVPPSPGDSPPPLSPRHGVTLDRLAAAVAAGQTIALVVAKDPEAAAVYYFRDAARALATYERLERLNTRPLVLTISPDGAAQGLVHLESATLAHCAIRWLAAGLRCAACARRCAVREGSALARPGFGADALRDVVR